MTDLVPAADVEGIVGAKRHPTEHYGRAVSAEQTVYILHSQQCKDTVPDLRDCPFSVALDRGIDGVPTAQWELMQDRPVRLGMVLGYLVPREIASDGSNE